MGEIGIAHASMPRKGPKVRGNVSARDDALRALRNAVGSLFAVFKVRFYVMGRKT